MHSGPAEGGSVAICLLQIRQRLLIQLHRVPRQPTLYLTASQMKSTMERESNKKATEKKDKETEIVRDRMRRNWRNLNNRSEEWYMKLGFQEMEERPVEVNCNFCLSLEKWAKKLTWPNGVQSY